MGLPNSKVKKAVSIDSAAWRDYILAKEVRRDAYVDHFKDMDIVGSRPSTSTGYSVDGTGSSGTVHRGNSTQAEPIIQRVFVARTEFSVANPFEDDDYLDLLSDHAGNPQQHGTDISDELNKAIGYESFEQRTRFNQRKRQSAWTPAGGGGAAASGFSGGAAPSASAGYAMNENAGFGGRGYGGLIGGFAIARESPSRTTEVSASALDASLSRSRAYRAGVETPLSDKENPLKMADDGAGEHKRRTVADVLRRRRRSKPDTAAAGEKRVHFEQYQ